MHILRLVATRRHQPEDRCRWTRTAGGTSVDEGAARFVLLSLLVFVSHWIVGVWGVERRRRGGWPRRWLINWEAQRPLTLMMLGDRADEERRLARSFSGWTCRRWCPRVEKGNAPQKNTAGVFSFLFSSFLSALFIYSLFYSQFLAVLHLTSWFSLSSLSRTFENRSFMSGRSILEDQIIQRLWLLFARFKMNTDDLFYWLLKTIKLLHSPGGAIILSTDECGFISLFTSFTLMSYFIVAALFQCPGSFLFAAHIFNISINTTTVHLHINKTVCL